MNSKEIMKKNGRTFFWASQFLPHEEAQNIQDLYAFCRFVDDLVDVQGKCCGQIVEDLEKKRSHIEQVQALLCMASKKKMSLEPAKILVSTLDKDRKGKIIDTYKELLRYCYGVASTVGLMMCDIFSVQNKAAYPFAIDLGIAMQLTNIARDIYEDAMQDKIYLPQEVFGKKITPESIQAQENLNEVLLAREQILMLADRYYLSADLGMRFLPRRARLAILMASRLYQAKGKTIRTRSAFYLKNRADTSLLAKIYQTSRAICSFCFDPKYSSAGEAVHDASLHSDLLFLPAIHQQ